MIFCQYQTKFDKLSFLRMHVLADFAADFDHDYNHSLPPASIERFFLFVSKFVWPFRRQ